MKNKKIISVLVVYCLLIRISVMNTGCVSLSPAGEDNDLAQIKNYKGKILLKLKDQTYLMTASQNFIFVSEPSDLIFGKGNVYDYKTRESSDFIGIIDKKDIDSNLVTGKDPRIYHLFWTKDSKKYSFENSNFTSITPDSGKNFWIVKNYYKGEFRIIKNEDIREISIEKTNWVLTSLLALGGIGLAAVTTLAVGLWDCNLHSK